MGVDIDREKLKQIEKKIPPIYEEGLKELLDEIVPKKLKVSTEIKNSVLSADLVFICVGTPSKKEGSMSLVQLENVSKEIGLAIKKKNKFYLQI